METSDTDKLPAIATEYIESVIRAMRYRKQVRGEVRRELTDHFIDTLSDCETEDLRKQCAEALIAKFGDAKLLGTLLRRAKKRCRPVWKKTLIFTLQTAGVILLLGLLRFGYLASGKPVINTDYTQWLYQQVRNGRDESLNAWHDYQQAIALHQSFPEDIEKIQTYPSKQEKTPQDWQVIEEYLHTETDAINALRRGAAKPYYWNHYQLSGDVSGQMGMATKVVENLMPDMSGYKRLAITMAQFQIPHDLYVGDTRQAVEDALAFYRFSQHIKSQGILIEQLVGVSLESLAMSSAWDLIDQSIPSAEDLSHLQEIVETDYRPGVAPMNWTLEKAFWYDQIQRTFTDDGQGGGHPLPAGMLLVANDAADFVKGFVAGFPDRRETKASIDCWFEQSNQYRTITPFNQKNTQQSSDEQMFSAAGQSMAIGQLQRLEVPAIKKSIEISWRMRTGQAGLIGTLAILRFQKENSRLPADWQELYQQGYLKTIPMDPYSNKPLVYQKTEYGFTVYSVGSNFADDGGAPSTNDQGESEEWGSHGDWIFWPPVDN